MIDQLLSLGITSKLNFEQTIKVKLLNVVSIIFFTVLLFFIGLHLFYTHKYNVALLQIGFASFIPLILYFQYKEQYRVSKIIFFALLNSVVFVLSMFLLPGKGVENFYIGTTILVLVLLDKPAFVYIIAIVEVLLFIAPHLYLNPYPIQNYSFITNIIATFSTIMAVRFFIDIQNQYKENLEVQKTRLEKLNLEKNDLMKIVAHDLKSPLSQIKGLISLLELSNNSLSQEQLELIKKIKTVTDSQNKQISGYLSGDKFEQEFEHEDLEVLPVRNIVELALDSMLAQAVAKGVRLTYVKGSSQNLMVLGKESWMLKIATNLITNAINHSNSGSEVTVSIQATTDSAIITIKDEGKGYGTKEVDHLFSSNNAKHIGLYIADKYLSKMDGSIKVKTSEGEGATFSITLPLLH